MKQAGEKAARNYKDIGWLSSVERVGAALGAGPAGE